MEQRHLADLIYLILRTPYILVRDKIKGIEGNQYEDMDERSKKCSENFWQKIEGNDIAAELLFRFFVYFFFFSSFLYHFGNLMNKKDFVIFEMFCSFFFLRILGQIFMNIPKMPYAQNVKLLFSLFCQSLVLCLFIYCTMDRSGDAQIIKVKSN